MQATSFELYLESQRARPQIWMLIWKHQKAGCFFSLFTLKKKAFQIVFQTSTPRQHKQGTTVTPPLLPPPQIWPKAADKKVADLQIKSR